MAFAVIKTGGKQHKVVEGDKFLIEKIDHEIGKEFDFDEVLMVGNGSASSRPEGEARPEGAAPQANKPESLKIGQPFIKGAKVRARVLDQGKGKKKIVFKYSNKTRYKKKKGHRQPYTKVEILKISA